MAVTALSGLVLAGYGVPFFGLPVSLLIPLAAYQFGGHLWPDTPGRRRIGLGFLGWLGLWLPAIAYITTPLLSAAGLDLSTGWLVIPLCGPTASLAVVIPAVAASLVVAAGATTSALGRTPWPWVMAAWLAPWAHQLAFAACPTR